MDQDLQDQSLAADQAENLPEDDRTTGLSFTVLFFLLEKMDQDLQDQSFNDDQAKNLPGDDRADGLSARGLVLLLGKDRAFQEGVQS